MIDGEPPIPKKDFDDFRSAQLAILARTDSIGTLLFPDLSAMMLVDEWFPIHHDGEPPPQSPIQIITSLGILCSDERYVLLENWPWSRSEMAEAVFGGLGALGALMVPSYQHWQIIGADKYCYRTPLIGNEKQSSALFMPMQSTVQTSETARRTFNDDGSVASEEFIKYTRTGLIGPNHTAIAFNSVKDNSGWRRIIQVAEHTPIPHVEYSDEDEVRSVRTWAELTGSPHATVEKLNGPEDDRSGRDVLVRFAGDDGLQRSEIVQVKTIAHEALRRSLSTGEALEITETAESICQRLKKYATVEGNFLLLDGHFGSLSKEDFDYVRPAILETVATFRFRFVWYLSSAFRFTERLK